MGSRTTTLQAKCKKLGGKHPSQVRFAIKNQVQNFSSCIFISCHWDISTFCTEFGSFVGSLGNFDLCQALLVEGTLKK